MLGRCHSSSICCDDCPISSRTSKISRPTTNHEVVSKLWLVGLIDMPMPHVDSEIEMKVDCNKDWTSIGQVDGDGLVEEILSGNVRSSAVTQNDTSLICD